MTLVPLWKISHVASYNIKQSEFSLIKRVITDKVQKRDECKVERDSERGIQQGMIQSGKKKMRED